jgi:hypothetical protein
MQSLSEIIKKIKQVNLEDYRQVLQKRPLSKQEENKEWYLAKEEVKKLPIDWQTYLSDLVEKGAKSTEDKQGICAHFLVNGHETELNVKLKNGSADRVNYIIYDKKRTKCFVREIVSI